MTARENILSDFRADSFTIFVWCDACGHSGTFDRAQASEKIRMQTLHDNLRCSACGSRHVSIRIAYTGAGGFHYATPPCAE
jgi:hypothetical protein